MGLMHLFLIFIRTRQLRETKNKALEELRDYQLQMQDSNFDNHDGDLWEQKCIMLEGEIKQRKKAQEQMELEIQKLREDVKASQKTHLEKITEISKSNDTVLSLENAPPAVMKELHNVRLCLAETERENRQLTRSNNDLNNRISSLLREKEAGLLALKKLPALQSELQDLQRKHQITIMEDGAWKEFAASLGVALEPHGVKLRPGNGPPDVTCVTNCLVMAHNKLAETKANVETLNDAMNSIKHQAVPFESRIVELEAQLLCEKQERTSLQAIVSAKERELEDASNVKRVLEQENGSLRELIKTCDKLPLAKDDDETFDSSGRALEVTLNASRAELELLKKEKLKLAKDLEESTTLREELAKDVDRIKDKFGKLKNALMAERVKVEAAEQRADNAESLAGKGSFNPKMTRVLHLKESPLVEALREEISVLQRQVEASKSDRSSKAVADPEKLNKRLKENFKEQISVFREGVYLMTGFKVDMLPGTDRPTFRVRSVFSDQESDQLLLKWPKGEEASSLDILNTDLAKVLSQTPSYDYMQKFQSLPAFLASVQLSLFEKQTLM